MLLALTVFALVRRPAAGQFGFRSVPLQEVEIGKRIAPVPLNLNGKNAQEVFYGSYLVNAVAACNDCHTNPSYADGGDPHSGQPEKINAAGYLAGGTSFGPFLSRNLTPDASGLPADLTNEQFVEVLTKGTDFKNVHPQISPLLQVMPWPVYAHMTRSQIDAIYTYLSAIPSVSNPNVP